LVAVIELCECAARVSFFDPAEAIARRHLGDRSVTEFQYLYTKGRPFRFGDAEALIEALFDRLELDLTQRPWPKMSNASSG
jgi:hypothetical protein